MLSPRTAKCTGHALLSWRDENSGGVSRLPVASAPIDQTPTHLEIFQIGFLANTCILNILEGIHHRKDRVADLHFPMVVMLVKKMKRSTSGYL